MRMINGSARADFLFGFSSAEHILAGAGNDLIFAGGGDDIIDGGKGNDTIFGGAGTDTVELAGSYQGYTWSSNGNGLLNFFGLLGPSLSVTGTDGTDRLYGVEFLRFDDATVDLRTGIITRDNSAPVGSATTTLAHATEDAAYIVSAADLLLGFSDPDGDTLSVAGLTSNQGAVVDNGNGTFTVTPTANYNGPATLSYTVVDGHNGSLSTSLGYTVDPVNDAPVAVSDTNSITEDATPNTISGNVLANDSDVDGDTLSVTNGGTFTLNYGVVAIHADGTYTYTLDNSNPSVNALDAGESLTDSFTCNINDGRGGVDSAALTITINGANDAPVAGDDNYTTPEGVALIVSSPGILANDSDSEGDGLYAMFYTGPAHGSVMLFVYTGEITYTPNAGFVGTDTFGYRVFDSHGLASNVATVTITVGMVPDVA